MELRSTTSFKDIDIDAMLEHTTFEDFMKGMYVSKVQGRKAESGKPQHMNEYDKMMHQFQTGDQDGLSDIKLEFDSSALQSGPSMDESLSQ